MGLIKFPRECERECYGAITQSPPCNTKPGRERLQSYFLIYSSGTFILKSA